MDKYKVMFVDTETTGICSMREPYNEETLNSVWPFLTQVAWSVVEYEVKDGVLCNPNQTSNKSFFIKPTRFSEDEYSKEVVEKTRITYQMLEQSGVLSSIVLADFFKTLEAVDFVVAHNATFDMKVIKAEVFRLGWDNHMRVKPWIDSCYYGYQLTHLRQANGRAKFPTLQELYNFIEGPKNFPHGRIEDTSHQADHDISSLQVCFEGLCSVSTTDKYGNTGPILTAHRIALILQKKSNS